MNVIKFFYYVDSLKIQGFYCFKPGNTPKRVIIFNKGGNNHKDNLWATEWEEQDFQDNVIKLLVDQLDFFVVFSNFRGSRESEGKDDIAGEDINDIVAIRDHLEDQQDEIRDLTHCDINLKSIFMYGESMGVYKTLQVAVRVDWLSGIILQAGVYRLSTMKYFRHELFEHWKRDYKVSEDMMKERDKMIYDNLKKLSDIPILILHGTNDERVPLKDLFYFILRLNYINKNTYRLNMIEKGKHDLNPYKKQIIKYISEFVIKQ